MTEGPKPEPKRPQKPKRRTQGHPKHQGMPKPTARNRSKAERPEGRPSFVPNDENRKMVIVMVAGGIQQEQIAASMNIDKKTLVKHFRQELDNGMVQANSAVVARLFNMTKENVRAVEFWLTNRDSKRWAHKQKIEGSMDLNMSYADRLKRAKGRRNGG